VKITVESNGRWRVERGTSLVELLVVLALLSTMVLVAGELIVRSMQLLDAVGRSAHNPIVVHVIGRLRNDVQGALAVPDREKTWTDAPLVLRTGDGRLLQFADVDGLFVRRIATGDGSLIVERVLLRGVTAWSWRSPAGGVVDLRISYRVNPESEQVAVGGAAIVERTLSMRFAIRGAGGGARW
jgi:hypothetical protein